MNIEKKNIYFINKFEYIGDIQNDEAQEKLFSKGIEKLINLKELNIAKVSFNMNKIYQLYEKTSCFIEKSISQLEYLSILKFKYERIGEREIKQLFKSIKQSQSQLKLLKIEAESFVGNKQLDETHFLGFESLQKIEDFGFFIYKQNLGKGVLSRDALFKILDSLNNLKNIQICELKVSYAEDIDEEIMDKIIQILNQKDRKLKKLGLLFSKYTIQSLKLFAEKFININKNVKFEIFYDEFNFDEEPIELNIFNQQVSTLCQAKTRNIQIIQLLQEMNIRDKKWVPDIAKQFSKKLDYFPQQIQQMQQQKQQQQINNNNVNINQQMQQQEFQEQQQQQQQQQQIQQQQNNANFNNMNNFQPQLNGNQIQQQQMQQQQQQQQYQQQLLFQQYQFQQQQMQQQQLQQLQFLNNMNNNMQLNNQQNYNIQNQQMGINNNHIYNQQQHMQQINNNQYNNDQNNFYFQNNAQQQNLDSQESFSSEENSDSNSDEEIKQKSSSSNNNGNNSAEETKSQQIMNNYQQQIQKQFKIDQHKQQINQIQKQQQQQQQKQQQLQENLINHDSQN
ncbi:hypothetical protein PPERSA_10700 [Pseudocohnilembus persalinus]|uniref:Uncharacterized protein n=1 Tax=Pseudocohnilembus persalinus TaxID=266149 RepID=A0A0V0QDC6_PSEPJ|nr:hypothetical protein PPERSA_10700 [Pseudocohnilembus persalinus]|eukprot:KRX00201.1 hypothetical protein PPERSA_10700 [Pseudocohnilembus persalinus]